MGHITGQALELDSAGNCDKIASISVLRAPNQLKSPRIEVQHACTDHEKNDFRHASLSMSDSAIYYSQSMNLAMKYCEGNNGEK